MLIAIEEKDDALNQLKTQKESIIICCTYSTRGERRCTESIKTPGTKYMYQFINVEDKQDELTQTKEAMQSISVSMHFI